MIDQHSSDFGGHPRAPGDFDTDFELHQLFGGHDAGSSVPPLEHVMTRGRRLRFQGRLMRAGGALLAGALVLGVVNALPSPKAEVRFASETGGDAPKTDFGDDPGAVPGAGESPDEGSQPPAAEDSEGPSAGPPTTMPHGKNEGPSTTPTTGPAPVEEGEHPGVAPVAPKPEIPHSTVPTSNGKLTSLSAAGLTPAFDPDVTAYQATADHDVMTVTATLADPDANLYIQSTQVQSGQPFKAWVGDGKYVDIVIYSDWEEIGRYTITLPGQPTPLPPPPHSTVHTTNGKLASLSATGLSPTFDPDTADYTAPATGDTITVTVTLADPDANLFIQSTRVRSGEPFKAWVGDGKSVDIVIYSDWTEIGRYTVERSN